MSTKNLVRLVVAAAGLLGAWLLVALIPSDNSGGLDDSNDWSVFFTRLNRVTVSRVRFDGTDGPRVLAKAGDRWTIDGLAADSGTVARFWDSVEDATATDLVARNPDNHARMGLAQDSAFAMTFELDSETRTVLVGNEGPSVGTSFIRQPDSDDTFLLSSNFNAHLTRAVSDWRDRRVVVVDTAAVTRIELSAAGSSYALSRGDSAWTIAGGGEADASAVRGLLEELSTLRANGFLEEGEELYGTPQEIGLTALTESGDMLADLRIGEGEGDRWVTVSGDDTVFRLPSFRVDRLVPSRERLEGG